MDNLNLPITEENSIDGIVEKTFTNDAKKILKSSKKRATKKSIKSIKKIVSNNDDDFDLENQTVTLDKTDCAIVFKRDGAMKVYMAVRDPGDDGFAANEELTMALASLCSKTQFTQNILNAFRTILAKALKLEFAKKNSEEDNDEE